jgi:hypothetical protein
MQFFLFHIGIEPCVPIYLRVKKWALQKSLISHHYQRSMMNQISTYIARGDVCHDRMSRLARKNCLKDNFWSAAVAGAEAIVEQSKRFFQNRFSSLPPLRERAKSRNYCSIVSPTNPRFQRRLIPPRASELSFKYFYRAELSLSGFYSGSRGSHSFRKGRCIPWAGRDAVDPAAFPRPASAPDTKKIEQKSAPLQQRINRPVRPELAADLDRF